MDCDRTAVCCSGGGDATASIDRVISLDDTIVTLMPRVLLTAEQFCALSEYNDPFGWLTGSRVGARTGQ